jgi:hypothetical protein
MKYARRADGNQVTDWMPMSMSPVRAGLYEIELRCEDGTAYGIKRYYWWNGSRFVLSDDSEIGAPIIDCQDVWRGLKEPA